MRTAAKRALVVLLVFFFCMITTQQAAANVGYVSDKKATGVILAVVAVGVLIGVGVYFAIHHGHSLRGCTSGSAGGMQLLNEGDQQSYLLLGSVAGIKPGERLRVTGSKGKGDGNTREFAVARVAKEYGACAAQP